MSGQRDDLSEDDERPVLTIDLGAIVDNWRLLAGKAHPAEAAASVKADAYGLGVARVAPALAAAGARTFFVATAAEGKALRALLPAPDIYVLNGVAPGGAAAMARYRLRPCLCSLDQIALWKDSGGGSPAALHIDTGINRLGLPPDELAELMAAPSRLQGIEIALVLSHLACSDDAGHPLNRRQLEDFRQSLGALGLAGRPVSLSASSGIFLGPEFHLALVRPGASIYGLAPLANSPNPMRQVLRLEGKIIQVRRVDRGMTVGYGATHSVDAPGRIAVVGLGYADGFLRALGNRGYGVLGGRRIPVVGRVSMDLITLDVSAIPPELAVPGARVELIGPHHSIDELAAEAGSIGYELLTALSPRYRRVYIEPNAKQEEPIMTNVLQPIGAAVLNGLEQIGRIALFALEAVALAFRRPFYFRLIGRQLIDIGYYSLPVVGLTAIFTGMVLVLQSYTGFSRFNAESAIPNVVVISLTRELGPVLAGLMVAGRIGAAMAAEIGTMRVTEQIDALSTLSTNPIKYLVVPRLIAGLISLPFLVAIADIIGVFGGYVIAVYKLGFNSAVYLRNTIDFVTDLDVVSGLVKAAVFGFVITLLGCYQGYHSRGGAQGVGAATTNAVVSASIMILVLNYFLTEVFFSR